MKIVFWACSLFFVGCVNEPKEACTPIREAPFVKEIFFFDSRCNDLAYYSVNMNYCAAGLTLRL